MINMLRFSAPTWHSLKLVIMSQMLKIHSISICEPRMQNICHAKNPTFGIYFHVSSTIIKETLSLQHMHKCNDTSTTFNFNKFSLFFHVKQELQTINHEANLDLMEVHFNVLDLKAWTPSSTWEWGGPCCHIPPSQPWFFKPIVLFDAMHSLYLRSNISANILWVMSSSKAT